MRVRIHLHSKSYNVKPEKQDIIRINSEITNQITKVGIEEFSRVVGQEGRSFTPAVFEGSRKRENFIGQQVYALDFDSGFSVWQFRERAEKYDVKPAFIYHTFSSTEANPRFRAVFINDCEIGDEEAASILLKMLLEIFPEADQGCKDVTRMFFGGRCLGWVGADNLINLFDVALSLQACLADNDKKNYVRKINRVGKKLGVAVENNILRIHKGDLRETSEVKSEDFRIITSIIRVNIPKSSIFYLIEKCSAGGSHQKSRCEKRVSYGKIQNITVKQLEEGCMLFKDFNNTEIAHDLKFMIATNLLQLKNGKGIFFGGHISHTEKWEQAWKYIKQNIYSPQRCENGGCPYYETCKGITIREKITSKIRKISEEKFIEIYEAERLLQKKMTEAIRADEKGIYLISAQTALGKTFSYCHIVSEYKEAARFMIVAPTLKLQEEIGRELEKQGVPVFLTVNISALLQKLHLEDLREEVEYLYKKGFGFKTKATVKNYIKKNGNELSKWQLNQLDQYLNLAEKLDSSRCVVTTHAMFLSLPDEKIKNYEIIVDEDLLMTIFKNTASISIEELKLALSEGAVPSENIPMVRRLLEAKDQDVIRENAAELTQGQLEGIYNKELSIDASLTDFLQADTYHVDIENGRINYFLAKQIPDVKMTIVSATLNEELYRSYCKGRRIHKMTVPIAKYKGQLIQYTAYSMSRSNIDEIGYGRIMDKVDRITKNSEKNIITFKKYRPEAEIYYGKTEGYNEYKGKDLAVIGTPHNVPFVYDLIGAYLGYQTDDRLCKRYTENGIYSFSFMTFRDEKMKNLQFYFIESELEQAIGRARLLRCDCTVYLFSNFPCRQAHILQEEYLIDGYG